MRKYLLQVLSKIRKTKAISMTLIIMFVIATVMFNSGLLIISKYGNFYNGIKEELNTSDAYYLISDSLYNDEVNKFFEKDSRVEEIERNEMLLLSTEIYSKEVDKDRTFNVLFQNMDVSRNISKWKFVGDKKDETSDYLNIYVPDVMKSISGYQLDDILKTTYQDIEGNKQILEFRVKGYIEDIYFSSSDSGFLGFYLPEDDYKELENILNHQDYKVQTIFTNVDKIENVAVIESEITDVIGIGSSSFVAADNAKMIFAIDIDLIDMSRTMMATILSVIMVLFSIVIVVVCLLVVRFRIINTVEEDLQQIGSLKSVGYTSKQIRFATILQFLLISSVGILIGIVLSYLTLPAVAVIFQQQSGLLWQQGFDLTTTLITILVILVFVIIAAFFATKKIKQLTPINAIRGESSKTEIKKDRMQLEKVKGPLSILLAIKTIVQNLKQAFMIQIIIIAVCIAGAFGIVLYYNTSVDTTAFAEVPGMEITSVITILNPTSNYEETINQIKNYNGIDRIHFFDETKIKIDGRDVTTYIMDDYSKKETDLAYEGTYPKNNYEITLAGLTAERLNKKVGDTVLISMNGIEETFKVVGLTNGSSMGGQNASIRTEDMNRLNSEFQQQSLYIYLNKNVDTTEFINLINDQFGKEEILSVINFDKVMAEGMASYQDIINIMGVIMLIVTILVIALILYFMISSSIIKRKRELGIQKAVGYTTFQLMNQFSIEFLIPVLTGGIIGTVIGAFTFNPMMTMAMKTAGIMKANFIINPLWIILFGFAIIVFAYVLSLLITWRIRKISAYQMVTE